MAPSLAIVKNSNRNVFNPRVSAFITPVTDSLSCEADKGEEEDKEEEVCIYQGVLRREGKRGVSHLQK